VVEQAISKGSMGFVTRSILPHFYKGNVFLMIKRRPMAWRYDSHGLVSFGGQFRKYFLILLIMTTFKSVNYLTYSFKLVEMNQLVQSTCVALLKISPEGAPYINKYY